MTEPDKITDPVERARYWKLRALAAEGQVRSAQQAEPEWVCVAPPCKCDTSNWKVCCYSRATPPAVQQTSTAATETALFSRDIHEQ